MQTGVSESVADSCHTVMNTVAQQAVSSSEGGKRLRALLVLNTFDAAMQSQPNSAVEDIHHKEHAKDCKKSNAACHDTQHSDTPHNADQTYKPQQPHNTDQQPHNTDQQYNASCNNTQRCATQRVDNQHSRNLRSELRDAVLDLACAIEVFQTAALVHDDIIDESDLRRGKPSAHKALETATDSIPIGRGLGIMLGDLLATASVDIANTAASRLEQTSNVSANAIVSAFLNMHREVEIGQVLDLAVELNPLNDPHQLADASLNVFRWKTASYTTIAPLQFALLAAGYTPNTARQYAMDIGLPLGQAFQLADDLLDVVGSSRNTGKPVGGDIREGKRTVLLADALSGANDNDRADLIHLFEAPARNDNDVHHVIDLFQKTGAIERSRERISTLWNQSRKAIQNMELAKTSQDELIAACARFVPDMSA